MSELDADHDGLYPESWEEDDIEFPPARFLNIYLIDRSYGGPEEGGWWYEEGKLIKCEPYLNEGQRDALQAWCDDENKQRRSDIGSVLSEGRYVVCAEPDIGKDYPATRPHYE